jgi:hypothetical protein
MKSFYLIALVAVASAGPVEKLLNPEFRLWTESVLSRIYYTVNNLADI